MHARHKIPRDSVRILRAVTAPTIVALTQERAPPSPATSPVEDQDNWPSPVPPASACQSQYTLPVRRTWADRMSTRTRLMIARRIAWIMFAIGLACWNVIPSLSPNGNPSLQRLSLGLAAVSFLVGALLSVAFVIHDLVERSAQTYRLVERDALSAHPFSPSSCKVALETAARREIGIAGRCLIFRWVKKRKAQLQACRCPECQYDLTASKDGRCPECGYGAEPASH